MTTIDWNQLAAAAEGDKFVQVPEGRYHFEITEATFKGTSAAGNGVNITLKSKIVDGEQAGRTMLMNLYMPFPGSDAKPGAFNMMRLKLESLGVPLAVLQQHNQPLEQSCVLFVGQHFIGDVEQSPYKGELRSNIETTYKIGDPSTPAAAAASNPFGETAAAAAPAAPVADPFAATQQAPAPAPQPEQAPTPAPAQAEQATAEQPAGIPDMTPEQMAANIAAMQAQMAAAAAAQAPAPAPAPAPEPAPAPAPAPAAAPVAAPTADPFAAAAAAVPDTSGAPVDPFANG